MLCTIINAEENYLNIDATHFEANKQNNILYFTGDVKMTKNNDLLKCQSLVINTKNSPKDPNQQIPKDYTATGDVSFTVHTPDNILNVRGDTVYYYPDEQKYIIKGNGYLEDTKEGKKIVAEKIYIDEKTGHTKIDGKKNKPIKFRLRLGEPKQQKDNNITKEVK
jgi:lipopolysaccharide transport protein LptA